MLYCYQKKPCVRPYVVEENGDGFSRNENVVSIALTASGISILSRANADVTNAPDIKYATQKTRGEISLEVNRGFLSGRFLDYSLTRIRLTPTARNDIWR